ncbi:hypothetical protein DVK07_00690 [Halorubrum sp. Atlit-26R]|nr:hypothetical protein DVK07_00690 [Halorubrum sp. Atlit-26R]
MDRTAGAVARASERPPGRSERVRGSRPTAGRPTRLGRREVLCGVGLKGAVVEDGAGDVSTAGASVTSDEERDERAPSSRLGLWRCSSSIRF